MIHSFQCGICQRDYSTDATNKTIIKMMRGHAAICERQCRQRVEARFGQAERSKTELAYLYSRFAQESPK